MRIKWFRVPLVPACHRYFPIYHQNLFFRLSGFFKISVHRGNPHLVTISLLAGRRKISFIFSWYTCAQPNMSPATESWINVLHVLCKLFSCAFSGIQCYFYHHLIIKTIDFLGVFSYLRGTRTSILPHRPHKSHRPEKFLFTHSPTNHDNPFLNPWQHHSRTSWRQDSGLNPSSFAWHSGACY